MKRDRKNLGLDWCTLNQAVSIEDPISICNTHR